MSTHNLVQQSTRQPDRQEKPLQPAVEREPARSNSSRKKMAEPQSWALKWDGFALAELEAAGLKALK